jgi:hypothetical protein
MSEDAAEPRRMIYLGAFDPSATTITIPPQVLERANDKFDREHEARLKSAALAKSQALLAARAQGKFRRVMRMIGRRGR